MGTNSQLFLSNDPYLKRQWKITSTDAAFRVRLDGVISRFDTVGIWKYKEFEQRCNEESYDIVWKDEPAELFEWFEHLNDIPDVEIHSGMEGRVGRDGKQIVLVNGLLPFQVQGYNFMKSCERACYFHWSTGAGKTIGAETAILRKKKEGIDLCLYSVKPNNLYDAQKKLLEHTELESIIYTGTPSRREKLLSEIFQKVKNGEQPIVIFNSEKFREDEEGFKLLVEGRKILLLLDEVHKFTNRATNLYRALCSIMYTSQTPQGIPYPSLDHRRGDFFSVALSATPLNNPEDLFNQVRLIDPDVFGTVTDFNNLFVAARDQWFNVSKWKNLDLMSMMFSNICHQADKENDPDIAIQFPIKLPPETIYIDLHPHVQRIYDRFLKEFNKTAIKDGKSILTNDDLLAAIGCLQMLVNNPVSVLISAHHRDEYDQKVLDEYKSLEKKGFDPDEIDLRLEGYAKKVVKGSKVCQSLRDLVGAETLTDVDSKGNCLVTKLLELRYRIETHPGKVIVFTKMHETLTPRISEWFDSWNISHVMYPEEGDEGKNRFRTDPSVKVFLSTDAGGDSIDLPEATLTINYDLPLKYTQKIQRDNRQDRIDSLQESVQVLVLSTPNTIEDRWAEILRVKEGYASMILKGEISEVSASYTNKRQELFYILTGDKDAAN